MKFEGDPLHLTHVTVEVRSLDGRDTFKKRFLISTRSIHSIAPSSELRKIGLKPFGKRGYELADGEYRELGYGFVEMRFLNEIIVTPIVFGPDHCDPRIGRVALLSAGFHVDLANKTIRKLRARPLKQLALAK